MYKKKVAKGPNPLSMKRKLKHKDKGSGIKKEGKKRRKRSGVRRKRDLKAEVKKEEEG